MFLCHFDVYHMYLIDQIDWTDWFWPLGLMFVIPHPFLKKDALQKYLIETQEHMNISLLKCWRFALAMRSGSITFNSQPLAQLPFLNSIFSKGFPGIQHNCDP